MSQHDYVIDNSDGLTVRNDINSALGAIQSMNSGTTSPTATIAFQFWADTTAGLLKQRNSADSAWVNKWTLATALANFTAALNTKLNNIETLADVTDNTNVQAANAIMDSEISPAEGIMRKTAAPVETSTA